MADPKEILRDELGIVRQQIQQEQQTLGITDSGRSANSIVVKGSRVKGAVLEGIGYLETNFNGIGRKEGRRPPIEDIMRWGKLETRGNTLRQAAYLVARKIGAMGTDIFMGRRSGIDMDRIQKDSADRLSKDLADNELIRFTDIFDK